MAALLIAWGVFALALIAHAILDTPHRPISMERTLQPRTRLLATSPRG